MDQETLQDRLLTMLRDRGHLPRWEDHIIRLHVHRFPDDTRPRVGELHTVLKAMAAAGLIRGSGRGWTPRNPTETQENVFPRR